MDESKSLIGLLLIVVLVIIDAIVSGAEGAVRAINENTIRKQAETGEKKSIQLLQFMEQGEQYFNAVELVLAGANGVLGFFYAVSLYGELRRFVEHQLIITNRSLSILFLVLFSFALLYIVVLFGSLLPKKLALKNPERTAYRTVPFLMFLMKFFKPLTWLLEKSTNGILRLCRINPNELEENVTEEEIISIVNEGHEQGVLEANEAEMISNIIEFDEKEVKDIMTHRKKVVAIPSTMSVEGALSFMLGTSYSRFPLYEEDIDNITGILHLKDITKYYVANKGRNTGCSLQDIAREPYFIPDTQSIDVLFNDMQLKKIHMAIAVDEYGQTAGIVAMEDILEEIVGNILDEYDEDEKFIIDQGDGNYLMKGMTGLEEIEEKLGIEIEQEEYDTLNGFLISRLDRIPRDSERASVVYKGYEFQIIDVKNRMIRYVKVSKKEEEPEVNEED